MKKLVFLEFVTDIDGRLVSCVADVDYSGPWAECRGENTATDQATKDAEARAKAQQDAAIAKQNTAVGDYKTSIKPFQTHRFLSPEYQAKLRLLTATGASGAEQAGESNLKDYASRTGENSANVGATAQEMAREKERFVTAANIGNEMASQDKDTEDMKFATTALGQIPGVYGQQNQIAAGMQGNAMDAQSRLDTARAQQTPWWQTVLGAATSIGSAAIGKYCWIAEELYGVGSWEVGAIRKWLALKADASNIWRVVVALYSRFGERVAARVRRNDKLRFVLLRVFDRMLDAAVEELFELECRALAA
jgi:hypothetical protein